MKIFKLKQKVICFSVFSYRSVDMSDSSRFTTLVMMCASELASSLADQGHSYAMSHAASSLSPQAALSEQLGGITQVCALLGKIKTIQFQTIILPLVPLT